MLPAYRSEGAHMTWPTWLPTPRSIAKTVRDFAVLAVPAAVLWLADGTNTEVLVRWTHISPELATKATAYATIAMFLFRWGRGLKRLPGSEPKS